MHREEPPCEQGMPLMAKRELIKMREISINPLDNGYVVRVGCQSFAVMTKEDLIKKLIAYIQNPDEVETRYHKEGKY